MGGKIVKAIYGSVMLLKDYCNNCKCSAFIIDGCFTCCGEIVRKEYDSEKKIRECEGEDKRSIIPKKLKNKILEQQEGRCIYCEKQFDEYVWDQKRSKYTKLRVCYDHFAAWTSSRDNHEENLYASCQICNGIKSDKFFYNLISAKEFINERRKEKGY